MSNYIVRFVTINRYCKLSIFCDVFIIAKIVTEGRFDKNKMNFNEHFKFDNSYNDFYAKNFKIGNL